jgi:hypothetical protein
MAKSSKTRRFLIGLVVIPLASAIGLEAGTRFLDWMRGRPWVMEDRRAAIEEVCHQLSRTAFTPGEKRDGARDDAHAAIDGGVRPKDASEHENSILQPYVGWEHPSTQQIIAEDVAYFRTPASKQAFDVYVLGGSVAQLFGQLGMKQLVTVLEKDPRLDKRLIRMHDYACAGYKQPQQVTNLAYLLALGHEPDVVINLDGFNEAALGWANAKDGANPLYPSLSHWAKASNGMRADPEMVDRLHDVRESQDRAREFGECLLDSGLWRSAFLEHVGSVRLESLRRRYVDAYQALTRHIAERPKEAETSGPAFATDDASIAEAIVRSWTENSLNLWGMCRERGIPYVHVLQPTLFDEGSKTLTQKEKDGAVAQATWIEGVRKIYPLLREAGPTLAERGVPYLDATRVFQDHPEDVYYDVCHFRELGNELLATPVAEAVLRALPAAGGVPR